ncbi:3-hydroxyacyl-CoA dehydrogenase NAD-binding domain-containing protein [Rhodoplanes sp.]|uniref:3-hydroxyacyl-CoA dehydrogenase NAD-binding domain-containing protein n=1 Tax=Rhodoplanes sp. TaxID=1968906 RepID=UPI0025F4689A|nr:3-hydroxyacyl-CoA dehydrogenase NAD-binding domain-containing protein [Rhodoplanes sp.]
MTRAAADADVRGPPISLTLRVTSRSDKAIRSAMSASDDNVMARPECRHPDRVLIGHPFDPPDLIPLIEVVAAR